MKRPFTVTVSHPPTAPWVRECDSIREAIHELDVLLQFAMHQSISVSGYSIRGETANCYLLQVSE